MEGSASIDAAILASAYLQRLGTLRLPNVEHSDRASVNDKTADT